MNDKARKVITKDVARMEANRMASVMVGLLEAGICLFTSYAAFVAAGVQSAVTAILVSSVLSVATFAVGMKTSKEALFKDTDDDIIRHLEEYLMDEE